MSNAQISLQTLQAVKSASIYTGFATLAIVSNDMQLVLD
jgi:hypothetical protein